MIGRASRNLALSAVVAAAAFPALAQTSQQLVDAFSGNWYVFDPRFSTDGQTCQLSFGKQPLSATEKIPGRAVVTSGCEGAISDVHSWEIENGKIILADSNRKTVAELGGKPERLSGDYVDPPDAIILERRNGSGAKAALVEAIARYGCYFRGYSSKCAPRSDTKGPVFRNGTARIRVLVELNVRMQPRRDAPIIGLVPKGKPVTVNACLTASDGIWCRADFGARRGWMAKSAIRDGRWPVITFVNEAAAEGGKKP